MLKDFYFNNDFRNKKSACVIFPVKKKKTHNDNFRLLIKQNHDKNLREHYRFFGIKHLAHLGEKTLGEKNTSCI